MVIAISTTSLGLMLYIKSNNKTTEENVKSKNHPRTKMLPHINIIHVSRSKRHYPNAIVII